MVALVGAGQFGETFIRQCRRISGMQISFVCDLQPERARAALLAAGYDNSAFVSVGTNEEAATAFNKGQIIITADYRLITGLALDLSLIHISEPTRQAESRMPSSA